VIQQTPLDDPAFARALGERVSVDNVRVDFSHVEEVTSAFAEAMCREIVERRSPAVLQNALLTSTMMPAVQAAALPAVMAAMTSSAQPEPAAGGPASAAEEQSPAPPAARRWSAVTWRPTTSAASTPRR
jgi:hypothetical protein